MPPAGSKKAKKAGAAQWSEESWQGQAAAAQWIEDSSWLESTWNAGASASVAVSDEPENYTSRRDQLLADVVGVSALTHQPGGGQA